MQDDTFSFRVMLLSVYDEMLRGVSQETPCHLFLLDLEVGEMPILLNPNLSAL